jgi:hypothetical protein
MEQGYFKHYHQYTDWFYIQDVNEKDNMFFFLEKEYIYIGCKLLSKNLRITSKHSITASISQWLSQCSPSDQLKPNPSMLYKHCNIIVLFHCSL